MNVVAFCRAVAIECSLVGQDNVLPISQERNSSFSLIYPHAWSGANLQRTIVEGCSSFCWTAWFPPGEHGGWTGSPFRWSHRPHHVGFFDLHVRAWRRCRRGRSASSNGSSTS